jgi:hypothetical protein
MQFNMSKADFAALRSHIIERLNSDGSAEITAEDKAAVIGALDRIGQRLDKSPKSEKDLVDTFNDQELINQITSHAKEESRLFCERDRSTGSHVTKVTCMSLANWKKMEKDSQTAMLNMAADHRNTCPSCMFDGPEIPPGPGGGH